MAEIHVQKKRSALTWVWINILLIILIGIVGYVVLRNDQTEQNNTSNQPGQSSFFQLQEEKRFLI